MSRLSASGRFAPMKATAGLLPEADEGWSYEVKWDGMRIVAFIEPDAGSSGPLTLRTTNDLDATDRFAALGGLADATSGLAAVIDGEVVAFDAEGRPRFSLLQRRSQAPDAARVPLAFQAFDLLHLDGHDTLTLPLGERRDLLNEVLASGPNWSVPPDHDDGAALLEAARVRELEGIVAKRRDSEYRPGSRSKAWRKVKIRRRQEFVIGGWLPGQGRRQGRLGALLVGVYEADGLCYCGRVGTGFDDAELTRLGDELVRHATGDNPFAPNHQPRKREARFTEPLLVAEITFAEWTEDGRLRHPAYVAQRDDVDPRSVRREPG